MTTQTNVKAIKTQVATPVITQADIDAFIATKQPAVVLLDNGTIYTNSVEDIRLEALRDKGIVSLSGIGNVTIRYADGHIDIINAALGVAGLLAGVTVSNLKDSFGAGKFASRGKQIVYPQDAIDSINSARKVQAESDLNAEIDKFTQYCAALSTADKPVDLLPTIYTLYKSNVVGAFDEKDSSLWIGWPTHKLDLPGLISLEVNKIRTGFEHKVASENATVEPK